MVQRVKIALDQQKVRSYTLEIPTVYRENTSADASGHIFGVYRITTFADNSQLTAQHIKVVLYHPGFFQCVIMRMNICSVTHFSSGLFLSR